MRMLSTCVAGWLVLSLLLWTTFGTLAGGSLRRGSWLILLSSALTVGVLYMAASASRARGWPLFLLLVALYGGIGVINIQFEALAFRMFPPPVIARDTVYGLAQVVLVSAVLAIGMTRGGTAETLPAPRGLAGQLWLRVPVVALTYIVLYFVAGSLILPFVRHFYRSSNLLVMPPLGVLLGVQFLRGLVYVAALAPLMRTMAGRRRHAALVAGLSLSVFGGIAPLLLPLDDILPADVRRVHMLEIFGSNFTLGVIGAFLLVRRPPPHLGQKQAPHQPE